jgi:hypothetical protein
MIEGSESDMTRQMQSQAPSRVAIHLALRVCRAGDTYIGFSSNWHIWPNPSAIG